MLLLVLFLLFGIGLLIALLRLRGSGRMRTHALFLSLSVVPLLLTVVVPLPFALAPGGPSAASRKGILSVSKAGIVLSFVLLLAGVVLVIHAAVRRDRPAVILLSLETALAAAPAALFLLAYGLLR